MSKRKNPETIADAEASPGELVASDVAEMPAQEPQVTLDEAAEQFVDESVSIESLAYEGDLRDLPDPVADATDTVDEAAQPSEVETVAGAEAEETPAYRGKLPPDPDAEENQGIPYSARIAAERDRD